MNVRLALGVAFGLAALAACSREAPPSPPPAAEDRELERSLQAPLDKARAVEAEMKKARREQDARIEEGGG